MTLWNIQQSVILCFEVWCMFYFVSSFVFSFIVVLWVWRFCVCGVWGLRRAYFSALMLCTATNQAGCEVFFYILLFDGYYIIGWNLHWVELLSNSRSRWVMVLAIMLYEPLYITVNFLFHCRVLAQMPQIRSFAWHICSRQYLSNQELLACLMLQQLLSSIQEDCVRDVRNESSYVAIIELVIAFTYWLNNDRKCSAQALYNSWLIGDCCTKMLKHGISKALVNERVL